MVGQKPPIPPGGPGTCGGGAGRAVLQGTGGTDGPPQTGGQEGDSEHSSVFTCVNNEEPMCCPPPPPRREGVQGNDKG